MTEKFLNDSIAICALSPSSENCFIAYPANAQTGEVLIFDAISLQTVNILQAHKTTIGTLTFNFVINNNCTSQSNRFRMELCWRLLVIREL